MIGWIDDAIDKVIGVIDKVIDAFDHFAFICCHPIQVLHDAKLNIQDMMIFTKRSIVKMHDDMTGKTADKEAIAYMIERARMSRAYRDSLASSHEPDEICEQMMCYEPIIQKKAKLMMHPLGLEDLSIDAYDFDTKKKMFFSALDYYGKFYPGEIDKTKMIVKFFSCFCKKQSVIRVEILKANVSGDFELAESLEKLI